MISLIGTALNQWDVGRSVTVTESEATHVHFANLGDTKAVIMELVESQAKIPDYLLQTGKQLCVYAVANGVTIERRTFPVTKRERPEDYVYEDDQRNYIYELIHAAEEATAEAERVAEELKAARDNGEFNGPKDVYAAEFDFYLNTLSKGSFSEMLDAFRADKVVTLSYINPVGNEFCFYCTYYDIGYESKEHLEFVGNEFGEYTTICVYPDGRITKSKVSIGGFVELDTTLSESGKAADAKAVGDAIGDIESALDSIEAGLDRIIEIQNSLIGGSGL